MKPSDYRMKQPPRTAPDSVCAPGSHPMSQAPRAAPASRAGAVPSRRDVTWVRLFSSELPCGGVRRPPFLHVRGVEARTSSQGSLKVEGYAVAELAARADAVAAGLGGPVGELVALAGELTGAGAAQLSFDEIEQQV